MPLSCDYYGGCWGDHSKDWPAISLSKLNKEEVRQLREVIRDKCLHGTYVDAGEQFRFENQEALASVLRVLSGTLYFSVLDARVLPQPAKIELPKVDIEITNHGSIVGFRGLSEAGKTFLRDEVSSEGWQWLGDSLNVDHRMAEGLVEAIQNEGLNIVGS